MKIIIPVKSTSTRVENKNFRPFYGDLSLTEILLKKLLFMGSNNIFISCDDPEKESLAQKYNCNFSLRDKKYCDNDTPLPDVIRQVVNQIPYDEEIAWCQVTDPMFNDHVKAFAEWEMNKKNHDSLCVVYPIKKYLLNTDHMPVNFGFGNWHVKSQDLKMFFDMTFTFSILKRESIERCGYHIGAKPYWFNASNMHVDIDTMEDFELAKFIYERKTK